MFGGRNRLSQEEIRQMKELLERDAAYIGKIAETEEMFKANVTAIQESRAQLEEEYTQVEDNVIAASDYATGNVQVAAALSHTLDDFQRQLQTAEAEFEELSYKVHACVEDGQLLVEGNKHFTTPSKYLSEVSASFRSQNQMYFQQLKLMSDNCKQMGVLALNAAIEAGRLGDAGMQFVTAAEAIRDFSRAYEVIINEMHQSITESENKIAHMDEQIQHMVTLLKDNNMAAVKHMKKCQETEGYIDKMSMRAFSEDLDDVMDQLVGIKNSEEEIIKSEERNRLQIDDMREEQQAQAKDEKEILEAMQPLFDDARLRTMKVDSDQDR